MQPRFGLLLLITATLLALSGCGNKGPLYLPQNPPPEPVEQTELTETEN